MNTLFVITSMPIGGAEVLLQNLLRKLNRDRISPFLVCLKELGPLGEELSAEIPTFHNILTSRYDFRVVIRLIKIIRDNQIEAVVTVGAGDKMFWGRLSAKLAGVPVICSALHSTGWPDGVGFLNRMLTPITDGFIAVAHAHGQHLIEREKFPRHKVTVIPNGIDLQQFSGKENAYTDLRNELGLSADSQIVGIVAALRKEKNHLRFLKVAKNVCTKLTTTHFVIVGDGPERPAIESQIRNLNLIDHVHMLGSRKDIHRLLPSIDVFALTSDNEANPVSIIESLACCVPVVATDVGSVKEMVINGETGYVVPVDDVSQFADRVLELLSDHHLARQMGCRGRKQVLDNGSLESMVIGYENLLRRLRMGKATRRQNSQLAASANAVKTYFRVRKRTDK